MGDLILAARCEHGLPRREQHVLGPPQDFAVPVGLHTAPVFYSDEGIAYGVGFGARQPNHYMQLTCNLDVCGHQTSRVSIAAYVTHEFRGACGLASPMRGITPSR